MTWIGFIRWRAGKYRSKSALKSPSWRAISSSMNLIARLLPLISKYPLIIYLVHARFTMAWLLLKSLCHWSILTSDNSARCSTHCPVTHLQTMVFMCCFTDFSPFFLAIYEWFLASGFDWRLLAWLGDARSSLSYDPFILLESKKCRHFLQLNWFWGKSLGYMPFFG